MPERILVVDDNRDAADSLAKLIHSFGHDAKAVYGGNEALEETATFLPDMALVDIGMPDIDGYETVRQLREKRGNVHLIVVAVTAWSRDEDKRRAYESGFDLHIAKPMSVEKLKELLERGAGVASVHNPESVERGFADVKALRGLDNCSVHVLVSRARSNRPAGSGAASPARTGLSSR